MAGDIGRRRKVGSEGEGIAARFLTRSGHTVLCRNFRTGHLEIDIISMAADGIHFVEVKSRVFPVAAEPEQQVGASKRKRITAAAAKWLMENGKEDMECRFDVVSVIFKGNSYEIRYFPDAFVPIFV